LPATTDPYFPLYQSSLAYQAFLAADPTMLNKVNSILYSASSHAAARAVLERIFNRSFVDALDNGAARYTNSGRFTYTSDDGRFTTAVVGDGGTTIGNLVDAANALYAVYSITPAMTHEVRVNFEKYFTTEQLAVFGYLADVEDFYQKGPSIRESAPITYK